MRRKPVIIAYDIVCDKRRARMFRRLRSWSLDAQYSVFECELNRREAEELFIQLSELIDQGEDTLLLAWLDKKREAFPVTKAARISFQKPAWYLG
jgi:CRISPR-associated protein Cas2